MKTDSKKKLTGTYREDRQKKGAAATSQRVPTPPAYLTPNAKKIYRKLCKFLISQNALCDIDSLYIGQAAAAFARYQNAEEDLASFGSIQSFQKSGTIQVSPYYTIMVNERKQCDIFSRRLGLNVSSREKLVSMQAEHVELDDFFANLTKARAYEN